MDRHAWDKFQAAQTLFIRFIRRRPATLHSMRRAHKWGLAMDRWLAKL